MMTRLTLLLVFLLLPVLALAQATSTTAPGIGDLLVQGKEVYSVWSALGAFSGLIALVNLLTNLTKWGPVGAFMKTRRLKWIRPLLAVIGGALLGYAGAVQAGATVLQGLVAGLIAGSSSVGVHQLYTIWEQRDKEREEKEETTEDVEEEGADEP